MACKQTCMYEYKFIFFLFIIAVVVVVVVFLYSHFSYNDDVDNNIHISGSGSIFVGRWREVWGHKRMLGNYEAGLFVFLAYIFPYTCTKCASEKKRMESFG